MHFKRRQAIHGPVTESRRKGRSGSPVELARQRDIHRRAIVQFFKTNKFTDALKPHQREELVRALARRIVYGKLADTLDRLDKIKASSPTTIDWSTIQTYLMGRTVSHRYAGYVPRSRLMLIEELHAALWPHALSAYEALAQAATT